MAEKLEGKEFAKHLLDLRLAASRSAKVVKKVELIKKMLIAAASATGDGERKVTLSKIEFGDFSEEEQNLVLNSLAPLKITKEFVTKRHFCETECQDPDLDYPVDPRTHNCTKHCSVTGCPRFLDLVLVGWTILLP